jgi:hypothetical protein
LLPLTAAQKAEVAKATDDILAATRATQQRAVNA